MSIDKNRYQEYYALTEHQRRSLISSNYFRVLSGIPIIEVPTEDKRYHEYFDRRCYSIYEENHKHKNKQQQDKPESSIRQPRKLRPSECKNHAPVPHEEDGEYYCERCGTHLEKKETPKPVTKKASVQPGQVKQEKKQEEDRPKQKNTDQGTLELF